MDPVGGRGGKKRISPLFLGGGAIQYIRYASRGRQNPLPTVPKVTHVTPMFTYPYQPGGWPLILVRPGLWNSHSETPTEAKYKSRMHLVLRIPFSSISHTMDNFDNWLIFLKILFPSLSGLLLWKHTRFDQRLAKPVHNLHQGM